LAWNNSLLFFVVNIFSTCSSIRSSASCDRVGVMKPIETSDVQHARCELSQPIEAVFLRSFVCAHGSAKDNHQ
jgi:hypothetical protein